MQNDTTLTQIILLIFKKCSLHCGCKSLSRAELHFMISFVFMSAAKQKDLSMSMCDTHTRTHLSQEIRAALQRVTVRHVVVLALENSAVTFQVSYQDRCGSGCISRCLPRLRPRPRPCPQRPHQPLAPPRCLHVWRRCSPVSSRCC